MSQQISWSTFVFQTPPKPGHPTVFHAFCQDCGCEVKPCWRCNKRKEYLNGCCPDCWNSFACSQQGELVDPSIAPFFLCTDCELNQKLESMYGSNVEKHPRKQVWDFRYKPACTCCPLSSDNFIRIPHMIEQEAIRTPFSDNQDLMRKRNARLVFQKELKLSGNYAQALLAYSSFFLNRPSKEKSTVLQKFLY
jgi:hypothetical protein